MPMSNDTQAAEPVLLTVQEVAKMHRVPTSWVYEHTRERCKRRIPGIRLGKYWRFIASDVAAWVADQRTNH